MSEELKEKAKSKDQGEEAKSKVEGEEAKAKVEGEEAKAKVEGEEAKAKVEGEVGGEGSAETKSAEPDWKDLYARLLADFDNYKKRAARDREDSYRFAESDILKDILPTVDNLALALASVAGVSPSAVDAEKSPSAVDAESLPRQNKEEPSANDDPFVKGVQLVYDSLLKSFKDHGAEPFDSLGKELDPNTMEAIAHLPSPDIDEGKVSNEVKRGWMLKGKLLRAAQVVVSSGLPPKA